MTPRQAKNLAKLVPQMAKEELFSMREGLAAKHNAPDFLKRRVEHACWKYMHAERKT